jgi:DMSO/TMAO reductase YedYZ molybdopterin-dependent catalytic subunit
MAALAGTLAAGAALAAGELVGALTGEPPSLVTAVGDQFVDRFAASLKDLAISLFGKNDKVALIVGIVVVSLLLGAGLGLLARRRFAWGAAGLAGFGALGVWAGLGDPLGSPATVWLSALAAVTAGVGVLWWVLEAAARSGQQAASAGDDTLAEDEDDQAEPSAIEDPRWPHTPRRAFLGWAGGIGAGAAVAGAGALSLRGRSNVEGERADIVLPTPAEVTRTPAVAEPADVAGLTPYIVPNDDFYRIDTALRVPQVEAASWTLRVEGKVDRPLELSYDDLLARDLVETPVTLACVSNRVGDDLVGNARWLGLPLAELLDEAGVQPGGTQIVGESVDGFTAGFPTEAALDGRTALVAVGMNGEPLPASHGYPCRLVISGLYGYVSATKWLGTIRLTGWDDEDGYWIPRGWAKEAPVKLSSRIDVPRSGTDLAPGVTPVAGVAWSPSVGVSAVEVQVDDGRWHPARLGEAVSDDTWVQWVYEWDATPGEHELRVRAIDNEGFVQDGEERPPAPDGATGWHTRHVTVEG